ncbi:hypothetical protein AWW66_08425 [Micromonospora rosaria]|uniref:Activator of Hsp90 ATPase homologue 1/2-like C-terminal domain-containing protein n=1 Tax=Micromonospora rosaria TaxID=47874 RepID=A0A136PVG4_9ACTN|nr:SRPBCC domain-containing protein [Micromonospora rosaria]KXK62459.1 hypothetical protein AWW66_08425 [Micromonospora rosaria]
MTGTEFFAPSGEQNITIRHFFHAPRDLVFRACTETDLLALWWGSEDMETAVDVDVRPGGRYRYVSRDGHGNEFAIGGVYHDVVVPELIVQTFQFEGMRGFVQLEKISFQEVGGGTRYQSECVFSSVGQRDEMVRSGMEVETRGSMRRLARVVESLRVGAV